MRPMFRLVTLVTLASFAPSLAFAQKQLQVIATVVDPRGADITTLAPADVKVNEDGKDATVLKVEPVQRVPKLQILIDNGLGMPPESVGDLRTAVTKLLDALPPTLEVTMVTTAPQPRFLERATTDHAKLLAAVNRISPDSGAGRFTESMAEALDRVARDKTPDAAYTIVSVGTFAGDNNVLDRDLRRVQEAVQKYRPVIHVVLMTRASGTAGGAVQTDLGQAIAQGTNGRFETINVASRLVTLLPEIGADVARNAGPGAKQFRITFERPAGVSGALGQIGFGVAGKTVTSVTLDQK